MSLYLHSYIQAQEAYKQLINMYVSRQPFKTIEMQTEQVVKLLLKGGAQLGKSQEAGTQEGKSQEGAGKSQEGEGKGKGKGKGKSHE